MYAQKDFFPFEAQKGPFLFHVKAEIARAKIINYI
jgi:hypothetical protein